MLAGKPEGKNSIGRCRSRWESYSKMDLQEVVYGAMDWIVMAADRIDVFVNCNWVDSRWQ